MVEPIPYDRTIASGLKSKKLVSELEHPVRWSFMKVLREHSDLKRFYPQINPYVEVYEFRKNLYCLFSDSLDAAGDPWMYLIDGPERAMLIDTGFGVGDLKALVRELVGDKELIVVNTHAHVDHCYGNCQFDRVYCHEAELPRLRKTMNPHIWDYLFNDDGTCKWTEFDRADLVSFKEYEAVGIEEGHLFDLGDGYMVEAVPLPGHTPGQCGYFDHVTGAIFIGDVTGIGKAEPDEPFADRCTVRAMRDAFKAFEPRFDQVTGVFSGHGMLDQSPLTLRYHLEACEAIMADPLHPDAKKEVVGGKGQKRTFLLRYIYQGTAIRYTEENVG